MKDDPKVRDVIPREILEYAGREYVNGFIRYMSDLGFEPAMDVH